MKSGFPANLKGHQAKLPCLPCHPETMSPFHPQSTYIYKEYHSVCPLVGTGTPPPPLSRKRVCPPPRTKGDSPAGLGVGESPNSDDWRKSLALYSVIPPFHKTLRTCHEAYQKLLLCGGGGSWRVFGSSGLAPRSRCSQLSEPFLRQGQLLNIFN